MDESALRTLLNSLEASRTSLHGLLHIFTWFVVIGLGFDLFVIGKEFRDDWREFRYGHIHPNEKHLPKRPSAPLLILALLGTALIVIGVAGELYVDVQAGKIETQIRAANDKLLGLIIKEAGEAATSAKNAHDEADAVKKEAGEIQEHLDNASKQLSVIDVRVRSQGPRWLILVENKNRFIHDLKPFSGTKLTVVRCEGPVWPLEQWGTEQRLLELLGKPGSNWESASWETGYQSWTGCSRTSSNGLELTVSVNADEPTKKAAAALKDELLGIGIAASLDIVPPDRARFFAYGQFGFGADSPWAKTLQEPNTIFLLVAPSAMVESAKPSKKAAKTP